ncbi:MAG: hypothetical protein P8J86_01415 [Phycisphaerales bacterium]|nr:hypothetical protein [Phycisphaerales bacterium]
MARYLSVLMLLVAGQNVVGQAADECAFSEPEKLTASDGDSSDYFGLSVSISGDYAVIGAPSDDDNGETSGSAYVFERDGAGNWSEVQKLTASDGAGGDWFGYSVSISGNYAVIGATGDYDNGEYPGSAYVFDRDAGGNWSEVQKLTASDGAGSARFGYSVSISGDYTVIGARLDDDNGSSSGSAYVYKIQPGPPVCLGDTNGDLIVNLVDFTQLMVDYGTTGDSRADFNGDNIVDLDDFSILLVNYGNSCE